MAKIIAVQKEGSEIIRYQLSTGEVVDKHNAIALALGNQIDDVIVTERNGSHYLRSLPNGNDSDDLGNLPEIGSVDLNNIKVYAGMYSDDTFQKAEGDATNTSAMTADSLNNGEKSIAGEADLRNMSQGQRKDYERGLKLTLNVNENDNRG